jgi:hypothetical protein
MITRNSCYSAREPGLTARFSFSVIFALLMLHLHRFFPSNIGQATAAKQIDEAPVCYMSIIDLDKESPTRFAQGFCVDFLGLLRFIFVQNLFSFLCCFRAMELHKLYLGDFMQIDSLDAFPSMMVSDGKNLPAFKQKPFGHKVDSFGRLCPGTMKRLLEHNALMRTDSLMHDHIGAPNSLRDQVFFALYAALPTPETWIFRKNLTLEEF